MTSWKKAFSSSFHYGIRPLIWMIFGVTWQFLYSGSNSLTSVSWLSLIINIDNIDDDDDDDYNYDDCYDEYDNNYDDDDN